ncbi:MAG: YggS family pyridoxal phosphate-dependent enzyme [Pseudoflavonifractor sp.]
MLLEENIALVQSKIVAAARQAGRDPGEITLVAATKVQTAQTVRAEMTEKLAQFAYDGAKLHFIGHLQTNKVKLVVGRADMIESVGSEHLLTAIDAQAERLGIVQDILLEINVGGEANKSGVAPEEAPALAQKAAALAHVRLRGLMAVPPVARAEGENRHYFEKMRHLYVDIRSRMGDNVPDIDCLSMGMSGDYEDAVREGATLVRVGTALFGPRPPLPDPTEKA